MLCVAVFTRTRARCPRDITWTSNEQSKIHDAIQVASNRMYRTDHSLCGRGALNYQASEVFVEGVVEVIGQLF